MPEGRAHEEPLYDHRRSPVKRMVTAEQKQAEAEYELAQLRTQIALYFHYLPHRERLNAIPIDDPTREEQIRAVNPGLKLAPNPSPWPETWKEYLDAAARRAPRK